MDQNRKGYKQELLAEKKRKGSGISKITVYKSNKKDYSQDVIDEETLSEADITRQDTFQLVTRNRSEKVYRPPVRKITNDTII